MNALRLYADGTMAISGAHPRTGREILLPVVPQAGCVEIPLKGDLFAIADILGIRMPAK